MLLKYKLSDRDPHIKSVTPGFLKNTDFSSKSKKKEKNEPLRGAQMAEISVNPKIFDHLLKIYDQKQFHVSATHTRG